MNFLPRRECPVPGPDYGRRVALVGRPNVGKSTLLNRVLGRKLSIASRRPQTTRFWVAGCKNGPDGQIVYVDTPGLQFCRHDSLNRHLRREAIRALHDVHAAIWVVEALHWRREDEFVLGLLRDLHPPLPTLVAVNKVDQVRDKTRLLPYLERLAGHLDRCEAVPLSARTGLQVDVLERCLARLLPAPPVPCPAQEEESVNLPRTCAELLREKLLHRLGAELPYSLAVTAEEQTACGPILHLRAVVWVEREGQKRIVIGKEGTVLKEAGRQARCELEAMLGRQVNLKSWVRVRPGWSADPRAILQFCG
ncbi:MAG: GTPase Era [Gammaproteobacteria bacterium]|nr:GTPase Era [Gammaproteobacteria bacterium]